MKLRPLAAVFSAALLIAVAALAQDSQGVPGAQSTVTTGTVMNYTPNQCLTVREANGQTRQINLGADSSVASDVKVGSRVRVSQSDVNGRCMIRVEAMPSQRAAAPRRLPRTASGYPLLGIFGLLSLGAAAGMRIAGRKFA